MDPIAAVLASYLEVVSTALADEIVAPLGLEVTSLTVHHQGIDVPYAYQRWRIIDKSVCEAYSRDVSKLSACTVTAKSLFSDLCQYLQAQRHLEGKRRLLKDMYCRAARSYQPTIARVSWSGKQSELESARTECNTAIVDAMGDGDPPARERKRVACDRYRALQEGAQR